MAICPCCMIGSVAFLYDICSTCGWEYHGEPKSGVIHSPAFQAVTIEQWRATGLRRLKVA